MSAPPAILVVDDTPQNVKLLADLLEARGYRVIRAASGAEALQHLEKERLALVLLDIVMPDMSGYEVCRRIRQRAETRLLPVVMVTALDPAEERVKGIEAGADDFLSKPINQAELLARVRSLLRVKELHDQVEAQAAELAEWNRTLKERVREQVVELDRLGRLKRFFSPQIAELISAGREDLLLPHRREVTVVFADLRGFTAFAESEEPEEIMRVLGQYHEEMGRLVSEHEGTLERFAGDGIMIFFNDPVEIPDRELRAVRMAVAMREAVERLALGWTRRGIELGFGVGIASGYATLGRIGHKDRWDYAAIGTVTNLASRLCGEAASGQILVTQRLLAAVEEDVEVEPVADLQLKGLLRPVRVYDIRRLRPRLP